jgi:hypothetical protein
LDWCHLFAPTARQHRADSPATDQPGRNEIQTLGTLFPNDTAVLATSRTLDLSRFNPFFDDFEMFGQRTTNWFAGLTLDLGRNDDVFGGGGFRVLEHLVEKRELVILDSKLLGLGAEELQFDTVEFELEKAVGGKQLLALTKQRGVLLLEPIEAGLQAPSADLPGGKLTLFVSAHTDDVACSLPTLYTRI